MNRARARVAASDGVDGVHVHAGERVESRRAVRVGLLPPSAARGMAYSSSSSTWRAEVWTLARNADGTYTPGNAVNQGTLPRRSPTRGATWDGLQLVILDERRRGLDAGAERRRDVHAGNAVNQGSFPPTLGN